MKNILIWGVGVLICLALVVILRWTTSESKAEMHRASWECSVHAPEAIEDVAGEERKAECVYGLYQDPKRMLTETINEFRDRYLARGCSISNSIDATVVSNAMRSIRFQVTGRKIPIAEFSVDSTSAEVALAVMSDISRAFSDFVDDEGRWRIEKASAWPMGMLKSRQKKGENVTEEMRALERVIDSMRAQNPKVYTIKEAHLQW